MPTQLPPDVPDFAGKVVMFAIGSGATVATYAIDNPVLVIQAGRLFAMGRQVYGSAAQDWAGPVTTAVAWDAIQGYIIFDSVAQYQKGSARAAQPKRRLKLFG